MMTLETFNTQIVIHYRTMYRVALSLTHSPDDAADAVQDAMSNLWDARRMLDGVHDSKAYCIRTVRNSCLEKLRRVDMTDRLDEAVQCDVAASDGREVEMLDELNRVNEAIDALPPLSRRVLRMNAYDGCSGQEIAEATGLSEANVRVILSRTRKRLRTLFSK